MSMRLHIMVARPADLQALAPRLVTDPLFARYGLGPQALEASLGQALGRGDGMLVATGSQGPVGLSWFRRDGAFGRGAYLRLLAVVQGEQARGVGAQLLAAFETACLPAPSGWSLLCSDFNTKAQKFYTKQGYAQVGALPGFVMPTVTEYIFYKEARTLAKKDCYAAAELPDSSEN